MTSKAGLIPVIKFLDKLGFDQLFKKPFVMTPVCQHDPIQSQYEITYIQGHENRINRYARNSIRASRQPSEAQSFAGEKRTRRKFQQTISCALSRSQSAGKTLLFVSVAK